MAAVVIDAMTAGGGRSPDPRTGPQLRSASWFEPYGLDGLGHRSMLSMQGYAAPSYQGRPVIGVCNSWSELVGCNAHLRELAKSVKRGILQAGGFPLEFPVMSLGEPLMKPTTMLYRNLMAMDVEETIRANPLDGVVLLAGCDKTIPASLMGAASADVPAVMVTGGPMLNGYWAGQSIGACTDCWRLHDDLRAGRITPQDWLDIEASVVRSVGHCSPMGTASTMACMVEALGMTPGGGAAIPAVDSRRSHLAEEAGRAAVGLAHRRIRPSDIMTMPAFENAIRVLHAIGGSTNAIIHLVAVAGRVGIDLPLQLFDELSESTPLLVNLKPSGAFLMEDFHRAGGLPAVMAEMATLLHQDVLTVSGPRLVPSEQGGPVDRAVIATLAEPFDATGSLVVLRGNLCPDGAVLKRSAAHASLLRHEGAAVVFDSIDDMRARIDDPELVVDADSVLVLRNSGPVGGPGMPEWHLPIPARLLRLGVTDMVRVSDARMSGTGFGTVVLHITPEAAVGGPLGLVETGDRIRLDTTARTLTLLVDDTELAGRRARSHAPRRPPEPRGYRRLFVEHVLQADHGCDFDFLRGRSAVMRGDRANGGLDQGVTQV